MIGESCLTIEAVFHIIHMKEFILKEHLLLTGEIPPIIVVMTVDYREEDPQRERERYPSSDRRPPRRGLPSNGRPPDRYGEGPPDGGDPLMMEDHQMAM